MGKERGEREEREREDRKDGCRQERAVGHLPLMSWALVNFSKKNTLVYE